MSARIFKSQLKEVAKESKEKSPEKSNTILVKTKKTKLKPELSKSSLNDLKVPITTKSLPKFPPKLKTPTKPLSKASKKSEDALTKPPRIQEQKNDLEIKPVIDDSEPNQEKVSQVLTNQPDEVTDAVIDEVYDDEDEEIVNPFNDVDGDYADNLTVQERKELEDFNNAIQLELFRARVDNDFPRQDFSEFVDVEAF